MSKTRTWTMAAVAAGTSAALLVGGASAALAHDRGQGGPGGRGPLSTLVSDGTLTTAQATAIHDALKAEREADRAAHEAQMKADRAAVLADLVKKGTLTQAQADAISSADRGSLRELIADGTVTRDDLAAVHDALEADREADRAAHEAQMKADRAAVLADLVKKGTLTQAQADAVTTALAEMPAKGAGKGHGNGMGRGGDMNGGPRR